MSQEKINMRLCGGVFLQPVFHFKDVHIAERDFFLEIAKATNENICKPIVYKSLRVSLSDYKMCRRVNPSFVFNADIKDVRQDFDKDIKERYTQVLEKFREVFEEAFSDESQKRRLIAALLGIISLDDSISESTEFYINEDGTPVPKKDLQDRNEYCFSAFLVGIWHYVLVKAKDNKVGKNTIDNLLAPHEEGEDAKHATRKFSSDIGRKRAETIILRESPHLSEATENKEMEETPQKGKQLRIMYKSSSITKEEAEAYINGTSEVRILQPDEGTSASEMRSDPCRIFQLQTVYEFDLARMDNGDLAVEIRFEYGGASFSGKVSASNWQSISVRNRIVDQGTGEYIAWFWDPSPSDDGQVIFQLICGVIKNERKTKKLL